MDSLHIHVVISEPDMIAWLGQQGNRSEAVRAAVRSAMTPGAAVTRAELRGILREELARVTVAGGMAAPLCRQDVDAQAAALLDKLF